MGDLAVIDAVCLGVLGLAALRGLLIGLVREAFSLAGLGAAVVAVRLGTQPVAAWLLQNTDLELGALAARIVAGVALAIVGFGTVALLGRILRRGLRAAGLGFFDRVGGGALGLAEGTLVTAVLLVTLVTLLGSDHPILARSRTLAAYEQVERLAREAGPELTDVATPPP